MAVGTMRWNERELARLLDDPDGPVGRDLEERAAAVEQEQKRLCPVSPDGSNGHPSGHLRASIHRERGRDASGQYFDVGTDVDYALHVEFGTRPHVIESKGDYPLRGADGTVYGKRVQHPGTEAQPFIRPSLEVIRDQ